MAEVYRGFGRFNVWAARGLRLPRISHAMRRVLESGCVAPSRRIRQHRKRSALPRYRACGKAVSINQPDPFDF